MEREINFLSVDELDAVVGGRMNDGKQQLINKDQRGVPGSGADDSSFWGAAAFAAVGFITAVGIVFGGNQT